MKLIELLIQPWLVVPLEVLQSWSISLARAIAVRAYLIDQGVRGTRIDVRALGNRNAGNGSADRVDLVVLDR